MPRFVAIASHMTRPSQRVNSHRFTELLKLRGLTQRQVAKGMKLSPSQISLLLSGKRRFTMTDAAEFARIVSIPIEEVFRIAGIKTSDVKSEMMIPVKGWIDSKFDVHFGAPHGPKSAPKPAIEGLVGETRVLRYQTANTRLDAMDGALVYYQATASLDGTFLGRICVVELEKGGWKLRIVKRGYRPGAYNLHGIDGSFGEEDVVLKSASPVVWMKF